MILSGNEDLRVVKTIEGIVSVAVQDQVADILRNVSHVGSLDSIIQYIFFIFAEIHLYRDLALTLFAHN